MNSQKSDLLLNVINDIDLIVDRVLERGYDKVVEDWDDYRILIDSYEFRTLITLQIYEKYFLPRRHEFELQIISDIVDCVVNYKSAIFFGVSTMTGMLVQSVIGNAPYDLLKTIIEHITKKYKKEPRLSSAFKEIQKNLLKIQNYFNEHDQTSLEQLSDNIGADSEKIEPLLKLLGFKCKRKGKRRVWIKPD